MSNFISLLRFEEELRSMGLRYAAIAATRCDANVELKKDAEIEIYIVFFSSL